MSNKVMVALLCVALVSGMFVAFTTPLLAQGVSCGPVFPINGKTINNLPLAEGSHYVLKLGQVLAQAPWEEGGVSIDFAFASYQANKFSLAGNVKYAWWFDLTGNWQNNTVQVVGIQKIITASSGSWYGPEYIYEVRPYEQKYRIRVHKTITNSAGKEVYCDPRKYVEVLTLLKEPALVFDTVPRSTYVPAKKDDADAYFLHRNF